MGLVNFAIFMAHEFWITQQISVRTNFNMRVQRITDKPELSNDDYKTFGSSDHITSNQHWSIKYDFNAFAISTI